MVRPFLHLGENPLRRPSLVFFLFFFQAGGDPLFFFFRWSFSRFSEIPVIAVSPLPARWFLSSFEGTVFLPAPDYKADVSLLFFFFFLESLKVVSS